MEEVNIFIEPPPTVTRKMLDIKISHTHLRVGLVGAPPFLDEDTGGPVKVDESMWTFSDGEININLQKMNKAEAWESALGGRAGAVLDPYSKEEVKKKLMLERFQQEVCLYLWKLVIPCVSSSSPPHYLPRSLFGARQHPSFDFSGAEFNGQVPNARDFMGGVKL